MFIKNGTVFYDELFGIFILLEVFLLAFICSCIHNFSPGKMAINFYICLGTDPTNEIHLTNKVFGKHTFNRYN